MKDREANLKVEVFCVALWVALDTTLQEGRFLGFR